METMRREGFEFQVSRPRVITRIGDNGEKLEPFEELAIDVPEDYLGTVIEKLGPRKAEMIEMKNPGQGLVRLLYKVPARTSAALVKRTVHRSGASHVSSPKGSLMAMGGASFFTLAPRWSTNRMSAFPRRLNVAKCSSTKKLGAFHLISSRTPVLAPRMA